MGGYMHRARRSGVWKNCPICGERFFVNQCTTWAYRKAITVNKKSEVKYFDEYACYRKFMKEYEEEKEKRKAETIKRIQEKRAKTMAERKKHE